MPASAAGVIRPLRALVANAGTMSPDTRRASPDGYAMTFAVNYLAHAQLIIPGVSTPRRSGPLLAAVTLDDKWAHLRDGAFVLKTRLTEVRPVAHDRGRERRLWEATAEPVERAGASR